MQWILSIDTDFDCSTLRFAVQRRDIEFRISGKPNHVLHDINPMGLFSDCVPNREREKKKKGILMVLKLCNMSIY
jgi:hypothetical protein